MLLTSIVKNYLVVKMVCGSQKKSRKIYKLRKIYINKNYYIFI